MLRILPITMLLCLGMLSCRNAKPSDIAGTWCVTEESRQRFMTLAQQKAATKIVLEADGTFAATEVPGDLLYGLPQDDSSFVTGNGVWKLLSRNGKQQVQLNFNAITKGRRSPLPIGTQMGVATGRMAVILYYYQGGDADQGRRIEFEKR